MTTQAVARALDRQQTNGIFERFNKTILMEFYQVALRKKTYRSIEALQVDYNARMRDHNALRTRALMLWQNTPAGLH